MAEKNEKWIMFRNFMYNDLGITKAEIREWIDDAIKDQVKLILDDTFKKTDIDYLVKEEIKRVLYNSSDIKNSIINKVVKSMFFVDTDDSENP